MDRDFRCGDEIAELLKDGRATVPHFHILGSKEIENYLLVPSAIAKAAQQKLKERKSSAALSVSDVCQMLESIMADQKADVLGQYISNRVRYFGTRSAKDASTVVKEALELFEQEWKEPLRRTAISSGKKAFAALNGQLQEKLGISITSNQVIKYLEQSDAGDLVDVLRDLNEFARIMPPLATGFT